LKHEAAGTTGDPEYESAVNVFYQRHLCRLDPWPECLIRSFAKVAENPEVYHTMNGPSEFHVTGTLRTWNIVDRLGEISLPTLLLSGRYDEATPAIVETIHKGIPQSEWIVFEQSSHSPHLEQHDHYLQIVGQFLDRNEKGPA
jgi:proline-specific peptidase